MAPLTVDLVWQTASPSTSLPSGGVVTIDGGPTATAHVIGSRQDSSDFYGIILVTLAIAVAIVVTRALFGHRSAVQTRDRDDRPRD